MKKVFIGMGIATLLLGALRVVCGPVYRMHDGCSCGRQRVWFAFDECRAMRQTQPFLITTASGDPQHQHTYWDAQWTAQY
jgi:hypothetical protein